MFLLALVLALHGKRTSSRHCRAPASGRRRRQSNKRVRHLIACVIEFDRSAKFDSFGMPSWTGDLFVADIDVEARLGEELAILCGPRTANHLAATVEHMIDYGSVDVAAVDIELASEMMLGNAFEGVLEYQVRPDRAPPNLKMTILKRLCTKDVERVDPKWNRLEVSPAILRELFARTDDGQQEPAPAPPPLDVDLSSPAPAIAPEQRAFDLTTLSMRIV
jgi:hypothetical protein